MASLLPTRHREHVRAEDACGRAIAMAPTRYEGHHEPAAILRRDREAPATGARLAD